MAALKSDVSGRLFTQMVAWTLPSGNGDPLQTQAKVTGDSLEVTVTGPAGINGANVEVGVLAPDLKSSNVNLPAISPGQWQGHLPVGAVGTYLLHVVLLKGSTVAGQSDLAVVVPYSPEYLDLGRDDASLQQFARVGGSLLTKAGEAWSLPALPVPTSSDIFWYLLLVVAILWPLDIALRRLTMTRAQALAAVRAVAALRRPPDIELEAPPELARLRSRVAPYRRRASSAPPPPVIASSEARKSPTGDGPDQDEAEALSARLLEARRKRRGSGD